MHSIYQTIKVIKLPQDEKDKLYPRICICLDGVTEKTNYKKILVALYKYFDQAMVKSTDINDIDFSKMSYNAYGVEYTPIKDGQFKYYWNLYIYDAKENYKKSIDWLEKIYSVEQDLKRKNKISKYLNSHKFCLRKSLPIENKCKIHCKIEITPEKKFTQKPLLKTDFIDKITGAIKIIEILNKFPMSVEICTCNYILFDGKKYIAKKMETIPITTFIDKDDAKNIGDERIDMYASWFKNSSIGLRRIIVSKEGNDYRFYSAIEFEASKLDDLFKKCYLKTLKTADIFIRKR